MVKKRNSELDWKEVTEKLGVPLLAEKFVVGIEKKRSAFKGYLTFINEKSIYSYVM